MDNPYFSRIMNAVDLMVQDQQIKQAENRQNARQLQREQREEERRQANTASQRKFAVLSSMMGKGYDPDTRKAATQGVIGMINNPDMDMPEITPKYDKPVQLPKDIVDKYPILAQFDNWKKEDIPALYKLILDKERADTEGAKEDWYSKRGKAEIMKGEAALIKAKKYKGGAGSKTEKDKTIERARALRKEAYDVYKSGNMYGFNDNVSEDKVYQFIERADKLIRKAENGTLTDGELKELKALESVLTEGYNETQDKKKATEISNKLEEVLNKISKELD